MEHSTEATESGTGPWPLLAAGRDVPRVRTALAAITRQAATDLAVRQARAGDICAWLRLVWGPSSVNRPRDSDLDALADEAADYLVAHLMDIDAADTFCGLDLDLSRTVIRKLSFHRAKFCGGIVDFRGCVFRQQVSFSEASFSGGRVLFDGATFIAERHGAGFRGATFSGAEVSFESTDFRNGWTNFGGTAFTGGKVRFNGMILNDSVMLFTSAAFDGAIVLFDNADLRGGRISFHGSRLTAGLLSFNDAKIGMGISFEKARIDGCHVSFDGANVGHISFTGARLDSGAITMRRSVAQGGNVSFRRMIMQGGELVLDGSCIQFGEFQLDEVAFISGIVSLEDVTVEIEGALDLPWARYTAHGTVIKDGDFDGRVAHDFYTKTAGYTPQTRIRWGEFGPRLTA